jgi:hypothetical protein
MSRQSVEVVVRFADWSDGAKAGLLPASGEAGLTAAVSDAGGLALYLERESHGSMLHLELGDEDVRRLYEFLRGHLDDSPAPGRRKTPRRKPSPEARPGSGAA